MSKKRVFLSLKEREAPVSLLARKHSVSRITAWRARKRGWLVPAYHEKESHISARGMAVPLDELMASARAGVFSFLWRASSGERLEDFLAPFSKEDVLHTAVVRLYELSGHPRIAEFGWRANVSFNAARDFLDYLVWRRKKREEEMIAEKAASPLFGDNKAFFAEIRRMLGEEKWQRLWGWVSRSRVSTPPKDIADILRHIRKEGGLCLSL